jgi:hypothetical protein
MARRQKEIRRPKPVGRALGTGTHGVGLVVADEHFLDGIPSELAAQLHRDPAEDAGAGGAMRFFRGGHRRLAGLDADEPVEVVVGALVQMDFIGAELRVQNRGVAGVEGFAVGAGRVAGSGFGAAAADEDPALVALEAHAVGELVVNDHGDAIGVFRLDMVGAVDVPQALLRELGFALDLEGPGQLGAHAPVGDIHMMRAPAGDHAEAIGINAQPAGPIRDAVLRMHPFLGVGHFRRAAQPHLVVEVRRDGHFRLVVARGVHGQADLNGVQLAETSVADQLAGDAKL